MDVNDLKKKYPVTHGRDFGKRTTLEGIVERVGQALDVKGVTRKAAHEIAADIIDRDLLFGAWGARWEEKDRDLLRDVRGAIILAYEAGRAKAVERGDVNV